MPSTHNSNNTAINMDDLEEDLVPAAASSPPPPSSSNRSSAASTTAFSPGSGPSLGGNHGQPDAEPEVAAASAAATVPTTTFSATSNHRAGPELVDGASGLPLPIGMMEEGLAEEGSASAAKSPSAFHNSAGAESSGGSAPPSGLEVMDDGDGPPVPIEMHELANLNEGKKRGAVEIIEDDAGPAPPAAFIEEMNSLEEDFDADEKKKASLLLDGEFNIAPTREDIEDQDPSFNGGVDVNRYDGEGGWQTTPVDDRADIESNMLTEDNTIDTGGGNGVVADQEQNNSVEPDLGGDWDTQIITEAYPVEERSNDGIVIVGEPLLPWWKQKKVKLLLGAVFVLIVILAVSLGVTLSLKRTETVPAPVVLRTNAPSQSNAPSVDPSSSPTTVASDKPSDIPSYSPTACVDQISSNAQKIDLQSDDPYNSRVAVDGKDMVAVVQQGWGGTVYIIFYKLANGEWQRTKTFQEDGLGGHSVALSGNTAFVGLDSANDNVGAVLIYNKDQYGDWNLVEDPFVHDANATHSYFGQHVDIDGDLACVDDGDGAYFYHRENNKWVQFDRIIGDWKCSIAGDTIATWRYDSELEQYYVHIYKYNQQLNGVFPIQDPIPTGLISSLVLRHDYLVYWDRDEKDAFMYYREETNQTYTFLHQFNISDPPNNYGLALDNDIFVIGGVDKTHIFAGQKNGMWVETITLDKSYEYYDLSGRSLFAITTSWSDDDEVYYFDIEGCSQAMPTQTPSLSTAPSDLPSSSPSMSPSSPPTNKPSSSSSPSMSPSPTTAPSSSSSPSMIPSSTLAPSSSSSPSYPTDTCFWIEIAIIYDQYPEDIYWALYRVDGDGGDNEFVTSHRGSEGNTSYVESLCLQEGEYIFEMWDFSGDWGYNGICCDYGEGNYKVTSNGMLIVEGGEWFGRSESTPFSIPFVPSS